MEAAVDTLDDAGTDGGDSQVPESAKPSENALVWNFADKKGWHNGNQGPDVDVVQSEIVDNADCDDGKALKIWTNAGTAERKKVYMPEEYAAGRYEWRVFLPAMGLNDRALVAGFLYQDDTHELDFEIGSGTAKSRAASGAKADELLCYTTCQDNPWTQKITLIKSNMWHILVIDLHVVNDRYSVKWLVDGVVIHEQQLEFGIEHAFKIFCSIENLNFIGDHAATQVHYALFDYVKFVKY